MPVNEPVLALDDEDLPGEGHGQEVHDQDDDAGRHEVGEVRSLQVHILTMNSLLLLTLKNNATSGQYF